jgi:hypothetical protein
VRSGLCRVALTVCCFREVGRYTPGRVAHIRLFCTAYSLRWLGGVWGGLLVGPQLAEEGAGGEADGGCVVRSPAQHCLLLVFEVVRWDVTSPNVTPLSATPVSTRLGCILYIRKGLCRCLVCSYMMVESRAAPLGRAIARACAVLDGGTLTMTLHALRVTSHVLCDVTCNV